MEARKPSRNNPKIDRQLTELPTRVARVGGSVETFEHPKMGYKVVSAAGEDAIAELMVPPKTPVVYPKRESGSWNHTFIRAAVVQTLNIEAETSVGRSINRDDYYYIEGDYTIPDAFSDSTETVSAPGVHLFPERSAAENYYR